MFFGKLDSAPSILQGAAFLTVITHTSAGRTVASRADPTKLNSRCESVSLPAHTPVCPVNVALIATALKAETGPGVDGRNERGSRTPSFSAATQ